MVEKRKTRMEIICEICGNLIYLSKNCREAHFFQINLSPQIERSWSSLSGRTKETVRTSRHRRPHADALAITSSSSQMINGVAAVRLFHRRSSLLRKAIFGWTLAPRKGQETIQSPPQPTQSGIHTSVSGMGISHWLTASKNCDLLEEESQKINICSYPL